MTWRYKAPQGFPARFPDSLRKAAAQLGKPILLYSGSYESAMNDAEQFRFFRWCLRKKPQAALALAKLSEAYTFRTSCDPRGLLYLTANENTISDLITLNPHIAGIVLEACQ